MADLLTCNYYQVMDQPTCAFRKGIAASYKEDDARFSTCRALYTSDSYLLARSREEMPPSAPASKPRGEVAELQAALQGLLTRGSRTAKEQAQGKRDVFRKVVSLVSVGMDMR